MRKKALLPAGIAIWVLGIFAGMYYFMGNSLTLFDKDNALLKASMANEFDTQFVQWLEQNVGKVDRSVVHFTKNNCNCNFISQSHRESVKLLATEHNYKNIELTAGPEFLSSLPAVAVIDMNGKLQYFGPYSSGFYCAANQGLAELFIKQEKLLLPGAVIVSDSKGCYCSA